MAGTYTPYSMQKNTLDLDGYTIHGFSEDDDAVTIERDSEGMSAMAGADGEVCVSELHNPLATLKIKLLQNSAANSILAGWEAAKTMFAMLLQEANAPDGEQVRAQSEQCFVKKHAPIKRGTKAGTVEWEIQMLKAKVFNGGLDDGTV